MIITEAIEINGKEFVKSYSDEGRYLLREGASYAEALDPADTGRSYTEGELIDAEEVSAEEALAELVGVLE